MDFRNVDIKIRTFSVPSFSLALYTISLLLKWSRIASASEENKNIDG